MNTPLSDHQIRYLRIKSQGLLPTSHNPPSSPADVVQKVFGVQAQDLPAALLSIRARSVGLTAFAVEQARQSERTIVRTWCMRGTLHLITTEDARWLVPLLGPAFIAANQRRFRELGWDESSATAGIRLLQEALAEYGALTRAEIRRLLEANGLPHEGQAPVHLLYRASLEGILCTGPDQGKDPTYVLFENWLGKLKPLPRHEALAKIAYRYLEAYSPASPEDLASWSGLKIGEAREAWQMIEDQLVQLGIPEGSYWLPKTHLAWLDELLDMSPVVRLLPRFDTYLLGYTNRDLIVDSKFAGRIHPGGGILNPVLLVDGQALGTWKTRRLKAGIEVNLAPFEELPTKLLPHIQTEVADLGRFLGVDSVLNIQEP